MSRGNNCDISFTIIERSAQGLQYICRTCLQKSMDLIPIDSEILDISLKISALLEFYVAIKVDETDDLPKQVCSECLGELIKIHCFKKKCHQNESILKLMLKNHKAGTISIVSEVEKSASDADQEEQSGLESVDNSFLNTAKSEIDLESKIINVDDAGNVTVLSNASVQLIDSTLKIADNQLLSDIQLEHQYSLQLNDESQVINKHENEELEVFKCKICHDNFTSRKLLMDHAKRFKHSQITKSIPKDQLKDRSRIRRYTTDFKCKKCETIFNNRHSWRRHILEHNNILKDNEVEEKLGNFQCKICLENFTTKQLLMQHARKLKHSQLRNNQLYMCEICAKNICRRKFKEHMNMHTKETQHICEQCGAKFYSISNLKRHIFRHTGSKPYICDLCGKGFTTAFCMNKHKEGHSIEGHTWEGHKKKDDIRRNKKNSPSYVCKICSCEYKSLYFYQNHVNKKHKTTDSKSKDNNEKIKKSNDYRCELCDKTFVSKFTLRQHELAHGDKNFLCPTCGKAFFSRRTLDYHLRIHNSKRQFKCHICSKSFAMSSGYENHMRIHTGQKPYNCGVCNKKFRQRQHLSVHLKIHTGERPHQCAVCEKSFTYKFSLTAHMRIHTGDKPYKCPECDKAFIDSGTRRRHRIRHHSLLDKITFPMQPTNNDEIIDYS